MRSRLQKLRDILFSDVGDHPTLRRAAAARAASTAGVTLTATTAAATGAALARYQVAMRALKR